MPTDMPLPYRPADKLEGLPQRLRTGVSVRAWPCWEGLDLRLLD